MSLALVVILRCVCSTDAEPAALRVRGVRQNQTEMLELRDPALAAPASQIVLSYHGEPDRVFDKTFWLLGEHWWRFKFGWEGFGAGGWFYLAEQSNRLQIVFDLRQIKVIRTLGDIVFVESSTWSSSTTVVSDPSFSISWTGKRHDATEHALLPRVAGVVFGSRGTLPTGEVPLEHAAGLPTIPLPGPPSARFFGVDGFPWTIDKLVCDTLWQAIPLWK